MSESRIELAVRVQPRASRDEVGEWRDGLLVVRVTAPPVGGAANEAVRQLLAKRLGIAKRQITIARGEHARNKVLKIGGVGPADIARALD
jgi:uncharacterized protein